MPFTVGISLALAFASPSVGASAAVRRSVNILLVASIFCFFDDAVEALVAADLPIYLKLWLSVNIYFPAR